MLYGYPGLRTCDSKCDLEIVRSVGWTTLVICTELENNPGTSVTNAAEMIATRLCQEDPTMDPEGLIWIEHYPERSAGRGQQPSPETWDMVVFTYRAGQTFRRPAWRRVSAEEVQTIRQKIAG